MSYPDVFDRAGRALFGDQYEAPLAALLGVDKATVVKWREDLSPIQTSAWRTIVSAMDDHYDVMMLLRVEVGAIWKEEGID